MIADIQTFPDKKSRAIAGPASNHNLIVDEFKGSRKNNFTFLHLSFSPSLADTSLAKSSK